MPSRYAIEVHSGPETRDGVLNQNTIAPAGLPPAYGSRDDLRHDGTTQLHTLPEELPVTDETAVQIADEYLEVRPTPETPRFTPEKQIFRMLIPVNVDGSIDIPFKAQSLRVDNWSIEYVFIPQLQIWVPPLWHGAIYSLTGMSSIAFIWQSPPGIVQPAAVNTVLTAVAYLERLPPVAGARI